ncbi:aldo-keto reductase 1B-like [Babylonia areolata]|uniref:aldo-keto reductase 1B-like n=1 Tax=Babylonia areolata TaxID=304850 RepID=UPI003FD53577
MGDLIKLNDGKEAPVVAFGTEQVPSETIPQVLKEALDAGYRHIDTAYSYGNEKAIGDVLRQYFSAGTLTRDDVFVATKLWVTFLGKDDVRGAVEESLSRLQLAHVDLLLIHAPFGFKNRGDGNLFPLDEHKNFELENYDLIETWKALEKLVSEGKIRSLGVSNFNSVQTDLINFVATVKPVLNQVECHAYLPQKELQDFCHKRHVLLQAFAPLGSPGRPEHMVTEGEPVLLEETVLKTIGEKYGKTPAQVLIRNLIQRGIMVVAQGVTHSRIKENFQVFDFNLSAEDMANIDLLRCDHRFFTFHHMAGSHPQYPFQIPF